MSREHESPQGGILFVISAPSGAGKTTLVKTVLRTLPNVRVSVSHTTRAPRPGEVEGEDYHFVDETTFKDMIERDLFLEHATVFDRCYGTSREWVEQQLAAGINVILEIDWQGARQVRERIAGTVGIFILPPSMKSLEQRLQGRGQDEQSAARRMREARNEISHYRDYDYLIVNDVLETAAANLADVLRAGQLRYESRRARFDALVDALLREA